MGHTQGDSFSIVASQDYNSMAVCTWLAWSHTEGCWIAKQGYHCLSALWQSCGIAETSVMVRNSNQNRNNSLFSVSKDTVCINKLDVLCRRKVTTAQEPGNKHDCCTIALSDGKYLPTLTRVPSELFLIMRHNSNVASPFGLWNVIMLHCKNSFILSDT